MRPIRIQIVLFPDTFFLQIIEQQDNCPFPVTITSDDCYSIAQQYNFLVSNSIIKMQKTRTFVFYFSIATELISDKKATDKNVF